MLQNEDISPPISARAEGGEPEDSSSLFSSLNVFFKDWFCTNIIGFFVVSYWRGTWVLLDIWTCGQPKDASLIAGDSFCFVGVESQQEVRYQSALQTYFAGTVFLAIGLVMVSRGWWYNIETPLLKSTLRFLTVYVLGFATVNIWRGIWYLLDGWFLYDAGPVSNFWWSAVLGALICYSLCSGASLLASPAIFLVDGPGVLPPPIAVTILSSYRSITLPAMKSDNDEHPDWLIELDALLSYLVLPWGVVAFWRGSWYLMDTYLWGFTNSIEDLRMSIISGYVLGLGCLLLGCEDVVLHIPSETPSNPKLGKMLNFVAGRLRTLVLAIGAVSFWRSVWLLWDEYLGQTSVWSSTLSHFIGVTCLLFLGCLSCIAAPPSTLGVDAIAHPDCEDEPLFHNVPIPSEVLYAFGIGRYSILVSDIKSDDDSENGLEEELERLLGMSAAALERFPVRSSLLHWRHSAPHVPVDRRQSSVYVLRRTRSHSAAAHVLSRRHLRKRRSNQFYRSR